MQEGRKLAEDQVQTLCESAFSKQNRGQIGLIGIQFLTNYAKSSSQNETISMYRKVKGSLIDYSTDILPVILDEQVLNN